MAEIEHNTCCIRRGLKPRPRKVKAWNGFLRRENSAEYFCLNLSKVKINCKNIEYNTCCIRRGLKPRPRKVKAWNGFLRRENSAEYFCLNLSKVKINCKNIEYNDVMSSRLYVWVRT